MGKIQKVSGQWGWRVFAANQVPTEFLTANHGEAEVEDPRSQPGDNFVHGNQSQGS